MQIVKNKYFRQKSFFPIKPQLLFLFTVSICLLTFSCLKTIKFPNWYQPHVRLCRIRNQLKTMQYYTFRWLLIKFGKFQDNISDKILSTLTLLYLLIISMQILEMAGWKYVCSASIMILTSTSFAILMIWFSLRSILRNISSSFVDIWDIRRRIWPVFGSGTRKESERFMFSSRMLVHGNKWTILKDKTWMYGKK